MGYVDIPGCTMTQYGTGVVANPTNRPVTYHNGFDGMFSDMYGCGAVVGLSDEENAERSRRRSTLAVQEQFGRLAVSTVSA